MGPPMLEAGAFEPTAIAKRESWAHMHSHTERKRDQMGAWGHKHAHTCIEWREREGGDRGDESENERERERERGGGSERECV
jgi:hypothetical protein